MVDPKPSRQLSEFLALMVGYCGVNSLSGLASRASLCHFVLWPIRTSFIFGSLAKILLGRQALQHSGHGDGAGLTVYGTPSPSTFVHRRLADLDAEPFEDELRQILEPRTQHYPPGQACDRFFLPAPHARQRPDPDPGAGAGANHAAHRV